MEGMKYFYELFEALPRGGPGADEYTRFAFNTLPKPPPKQPLILDIGCGPGPQTLELSKLTNGKIIAVDNHQPFLDALMERAMNRGLARNITPKNISMLEMNFADNTFDIIWSEGALYFMGFANGLKRCRELLKDDGYIAVTECVYLASRLPKEVTEFFKNDYPDIKDVKGNIELIKKKGLQLLSHFTLPEFAWFDTYYVPMEKEISRLKEKYKGNEAALATFSDLQKEINLYKKYSPYYGYEFFVMRKR